MIRVVLDTNILVSALVNPEGLPGRILDLVLDGRLQVVFDDRILSEYREVLHRPRFAFSAPDVDSLLAYLVISGRYLIDVPQLDTHLPDPGDTPFLEVAVASRAVLVTGNARHYPTPIAAVLGVQVLSPAHFLADQRI